MSAEQKTVQLPWQGLLALAAAIAGTVWYLAPLDTSRPTERGGVALKLIREQDVDARLWQDPLAAAFTHEEQVRVIDKEKDGSRLLEEEALHSDVLLRRKITKLLGDGENNLIVVPVFISGGSYAEYGENRLRARRAVLEGLGTNKISPEDGEHIGYVRISLPASNAEAAGMFILPYEWCGPAFANTAKRAPKVLILWVREEDLGDRPLHRMHALLRWLNVPPGIVKVIGPRTSNSLRAMVTEASTEGLESQDWTGAIMFSPTPTVSEELLRGTGAGTVKSLLEEKAKGLTFHRTTSTDDDVCSALITELARRRIHLAPSRPPHDPQDGADHIALISEWDTFYGRALPLTFARKVSGWDFETLSKFYPKNIHAFHYLRGIDGMLPGSSAAAERNAENAKQEKTNKGPRETIEGHNQADYLRRLAQQLEEKNRSLLRERRGGLKAIGVLGSDVYDKLLVLRALRPVFPGVLFFTNNLDARYGHRDEWNWTRNLIIASPFGLQLAERRGGATGFDLQGKILPFRDSYQTATYAAALFASNEDAANLLMDPAGKTPPGLERAREVLGEPRLFEVAQSGPFELQGSIPVQNQSTDFHPVTDSGWWNWMRRWQALGIIAAIAALIAWISKVIQRGRTEASEEPNGQGRPAPRAAVSGKGHLRALVCSFSSWWVLAVGGIFAWGLICLLAFLLRSNGEPYVWMEGISIWPTETFRVLVVLLGGWFLFKIDWSLRRNEAQICGAFGLTARNEIVRSPSAPFLSPSWFSELGDLLTVAGWDVFEGKGEHRRVSAQKLWQRYIEAGRLRVRCLRVLPLTGCYLIAGFILIAMLGIPPVPARGDAAFNLDFVFLILAVLASAFVTFYVADATALNRRLISYLVAVETVWPPDAYDNLRKRWPRTPAVPPELTKWRGVLARLWPARQTKGRPDQEVPPNKLLDEYLDIDLIATRTAVVGELIYYPFVLITLLIVSRISLFDNWTWPIGLFIVIGINGGYAAWSAKKLREAAEEARKTALGHLNDILIARTAEGRANEPEAQTARATISMIKAEERGAFAATSRHPIIGALLLPSGGAGIWALSQYLPGLF